jgi:hypothetical protein
MRKLIVVIAALLISCAIDPADVISGDTGILYQRDGSGLFWTVPIECDSVWSVEVKPILSSEWVRIVRWEVWEGQLYIFDRDGKYENFQFRIFRLESDYNQEWKY